MREKLSVFVSGVVLGLAGLLSASAQAPPFFAPPAPEGETYESFIRALNAHEMRMAQLQQQLQAMPPIIGPPSGYQLELLAELYAPQPAVIANSSFNCIQSGGGRVDLVTELNSSDIVLVQARHTKTFTAKSGWNFQRPTVSGDVHEIRFDPGLSDNRRTATADFEDRYSAGQQAPHGQVGDGRYKIRCYNSNGQSYSQSWSWRLFRDCPGH